LADDDNVIAIGETGLIIFMSNKSLQIGNVIDLGVILLRQTNLVSR